MWKSPWRFAKQGPRNSPSLISMSVKNLSRLGLAYVSGLLHRALPELPDSRTLGSKFCKSCSDCKTVQILDYQIQGPEIFICHLSGSPTFTFFVHHICTESNPKVKWGYVLLKLSLYYVLVKSRYYYYWYLSVFALSCPLLVKNWRCYYSGLRLAYSELTFYRVDASFSFSDIDIGILCTHHRPSWNVKLATINAWSFSPIAQISSLIKLPKWYIYLLTFHQISPRTYLRARTRSCVGVLSWYYSPYIARRNPTLRDELDNEDYRLLQPTWK